MFIGRHWRAGAAIVLGVAWGGFGKAELVSVAVENEVVQGAWLLSSRDSMLLESDQFTLDWDDDGHEDMRFQHRYVPSTEPLIVDAVPYVVEAINGLYAVRSLLDRMSANAAVAASNGVDQANLLGETYADFQAGLDAIAHITRETHVNQQRLLDGTSGLVASTTSSTYIARRIPAGVAPGNYSPVVTEPARRASVFAGTAQTAALAADEVLTINGVSIDLSAGKNVDEVVDCVNLFSSQTGVIADASNPYQVLHLSTTRSGRESQIHAVASAHISPTSSGIGTSVKSGVGMDAAGKLDGVEMVGAGAMLIVSEGPLEGVALELVFNEDRDRVTTASGALAPLSIIDQSLTFSLPSGESRSITFPDVRPSSLGMSVGSDLRLETVTLVGIDNAKQAHAVVQHSIAQVEEEISRLGSSDIGIPTGENSIEGSSRVQFVQSSTGGLLDLGDWIGRDSETSDAIMLLDSFDTGYLGVALQLDDGTHYGWIKLGVGRDAGLVVHEAIWETTPYQAVRVGVVPEPCGWSLMTAILAFLAGVARKR